MPIAWCLSPVDWTPDGATRYARVWRVRDPGRELRRDYDDEGNPIDGPFYRVSVAYSRLHSDWALCFVRGVDLSALASTPGVRVLLPKGYEDGDGYLDRSPNEHGWKEQEKRALEKAIDDHAADRSKLTRDSPVRAWLAALRQKLGKGNVDALWIPKGDMI